MEQLLEDPEFQKLLPYLPYLIAVAAIQLAVWLLIGNTIRTTLVLIKEENRFMRPAQAFLMAIPLFNIYWNFMVVKHLRDSLNNEFFDRKVAIEENPTHKEGNIFAWSYLVRNLPLPGIILVAALLTNIVGLVLYWVKVVEYKKLLIATEHLKFSDNVNIDAYDMEDNQYEN